MPKKKDFKGKKGMRGEPFYYQEVKKQISVMLTPYSIKKVNCLAKENKVSRSEFLEQIIRKL